MQDEPEILPAQNVLESRYQRDLKWAVMSPDLIIESPGEKEAANLIHEASINEQELAAFLTPYAKFRVGEYFEGLVLYWLEKICHLKIVAQQQQIRDGKQTIGEIDFLFEDEAGELNHWETAVKFYLHHPVDNPTGSHFIGPNASDWFEKKINRLLGHQIPFGKKHFPEITRSKAFVKGMIFYHPHLKPPDQLPQKLSANHLRGTWIRHSERDWLKDKHKNCMFLVMQKPYWLSPEVSLSQIQELKSFEELKSELDTHFRKKEWPLLISVLACQQALYEEIDRVFVVAESWPQIDE